jgi:hypothetical protein
MSYIYTNDNDYSLDEFKTVINKCYPGNAIDVLIDVPFTPLKI